MTGVLRIIATPIGNLGDLSPRAADALRSASYILAEDTRRGRVLLDHVGGQGRLLSCHQHNERARVEWLLDTLREGTTVAFISDAGAPSVSDPGGRLVEAVAESGLGLEVIPGASAVIAAIMGAGVDVTRFAFVGFLPRRAGARRAMLARVDPGLSLVIFESPARVEATLQALASELGSRRVVVARELTKRFETFHRGTLGAPLSPPLVERGEMVIVIEAGSVEPSDGVVGAVAGGAAPPADVPAVFASPRERAKFWARRWGVTTREAYDRLRLADAGTAAGGEAPPCGDGDGSSDASNATDEGTDRILAPAARAIIARAQASAVPRRRMREALLDSAMSFLRAEQVAAGDGDGVRRAAGGSLEPSPASPPTQMALISALSRFDRAHTWMPAPVEAEACARALMAALAAIDELDDAVEAAAEAATSSV